MKTIVFHQRFGAVCGDGSLALTFLNTEVLPALEVGEHLELDFHGVRVLNSSFSNALFGNLVKVQGKGALINISIRHACDLVKAEIKSGIAYGLRSTIKAA